MKCIYTPLSLLAGLLLIASCGNDDENPGEVFDIPEGYSLVWQDEFNSTSIDMTNWGYETGDGTDYGLPRGWGNNESQLYTENAENSGIEEFEGESTLAIKALSDGNGGYTSAKLTTQRKFSMRFGRVDVRAKMPEGQGIWPAIWMLGDNIDEIAWPGCGEIDIVEVLGHQPEKMYSTVHYTNAESSRTEQQGNVELSSGSFSDAFHTYTLEWTPEEMTFSVDGEQVNVVQIEDDMKEFLRSFYLIMNVAVGGNWPGYPDNTTSFPQQMNVDYVRVFEKDGFVAREAPALNIDEETLGQNVEPGIAQDAIRDDFDLLGNARIIAYGGGGEPVVSSSTDATDGDASMAYNFPGGAWGGAYIELDNPKNLSSYRYLKFSLKKPEELVIAEIKLESPDTNVPVFLDAYTPDEVDGWLAYTIPLSDFNNLDLTELTIPFSMWNPKNADGNLVGGMVLIDNLHFSN